MTDFNIIMSVFNITSSYGTEGHPGCPGGTDFWRKTYLKNSFRRGYRETKDLSTELSHTGGDDYFFPETRNVT